MDDYTRLRRQMGSLVSIILLSLFLTGVGVLAALEALGLDTLFTFIIIIVTILSLSIFGGQFIAKMALKPLYILWKSITLLSDKSQSGAAPQADQLKLGRKLVTNLLSQLYQLASTSAPSTEENSKHRQNVVQSANIVSRLPLPLFVLNKELLVTNASDTALAYCQIESAQLFGKDLSDSIHLEFPSERTLEGWIDDCINNKVTDTAYWERVRVALNNNGDVTYKRCDIAAHYNKDNPSGAEFIVTMFDRTEQYQQDDDSMSFVALAVHELRTPLTMLRGYIEVLVDELDDKLDAEMKDFLKKMDMSARQLNAFVGNILNVARVDENALTLHLAEGDWSETLKEIVGELQLKASAHDKIIELNVDDALPKVAIDKVSIYEVVSNLIDNAIKYSAEEKRIIIHSGLSKEGLIETTVQDFGVGIPESVVPHIFEKFYRNHRTKAQISGTGLGLYLAKSLVNAHGGQIWVSTKPDEGSTFGFTLQSYERMKSANTGDDELTRTAHGWIKNHSLYRR